MTDTVYGCTSADFTSRNGRPIPNTPYEVWTDEYGGTQRSDLLTMDRTPAGETLVSDGDGGVRFLDPTGGKAPLWTDTGWGRRVAVVPLDNVGPVGPTPQLGKGTIATGPLDFSLTGTPENPLLNLILPTSGPNGVGTSALQDGAVTTAKIADAAVTPVKTAGAYAAPAASTTLTTADSVVAVDTTSGARTLTLPAASTMTGRALRIIKTGGANLLTVQRAGSDLISPSNGNRTSVAFPSDCTMGEIVIVSSGTGWRVVSGQASDETVGSRLYEWSQDAASKSTTAAIGWLLVRYDSGVRLVTPVNGWSGTLRLARTATAVRLTSDSLSAAVSTSNSFYTWPAGLSPIVGTLRRIPALHPSSYALAPLYIDGGLVARADGQFGASTYNLSFDFEVRAGVDLPTSLPGTAG